MTKWYNDPKNLKILKALLREEKMTFQQIAVTVGNRRAAQDRLEVLLQEGAVEDLAAGRGPGQAARYALTEKGEQVAQAAVLDNYEDALRVVYNITMRAVNDPRRLSAFRKQLQQKHDKESEKERLALVEESLKPHQTSEKIIIYDPEGNPRELDGWIAEYMERPKQLTEDDMIVKSLRSLFNIYVQVHLKPHQRSPGGDVVGFPEKGGLYLIPVSLLKKHGLRVGL